MNYPERAGYPPSPKTPIIASTIVEMVIERAVSIAVIAVSIPCSQNKVQILSAKDISLSRAFYQWSVLPLQVAFEDFLSVL